MSANYVKIGKLGKPHGVYGELRFVPIFSESKALSSISDVFVGPCKEKFKVITYKEGTKPRLLLEGISSPEQAKYIVNEAVFALRSDLPSLAENEFYLSDLVGASVYDSSKALVGKVESFYSNGAQEIIRLNSNIEIPLVKDVFIKSILDKDSKVYLCVLKEDLIV